MAPKAFARPCIFAKDLTDPSVSVDFSRIRMTPTVPSGQRVVRRMRGGPDQPGHRRRSQHPPRRTGRHRGCHVHPGTENALQQATMRGQDPFFLDRRHRVVLPVVTLAVIGAGNGVAQPGLPRDELPGVEPLRDGGGGHSPLRHPQHADRQRVERKPVHRVHVEFSGGGNTLYIPEPAFQDGITMLDTQPCVSQPNGTPYSSVTPCRDSRTSPRSPVTSPPTATP